MAMANGIINFGQEDTKRVQPLLSFGVYEQIFTSVVKIEYRDALILLPADMRQALMEAGNKNPPPIIPEMWVAFAVPKIHRMVADRMRPNLERPETNEEWAGRWAGLQICPDLYDAILDKNRGVQTFATPYRGMQKEFRTWMRVPFRTLVRAAANPGRVVSAGPAFAFVPREARSRELGTATYVTRRETLVGYCHAAKNYGKKNRIGDTLEWVAEIAPLVLEGGRVISVIDALFYELFQNEARLLRVLQKNLMDSSDVYQELRIGGEEDEEDSALHAKTLRNLLKSIRFCSSCGSPLQRKTSKICIYCKADQPGAPGADQTRPRLLPPGTPSSTTETATPPQPETVIIQWPCPHCSASLPRANSRFCPTCSKPVAQAQQPASLTLEERAKREAEDARIAKEEADASAATADELARIEQERANGQAKQAAFQTCPNPSCAKQNHVGRKTCVFCRTRFSGKTRRGSKKAATKTNKEKPESSGA